MRNVSLERIGFQIAGPRAREVLAAAAPSVDVSNQALRFFDAREMEVGLVPALVCRLSYTGDLGYEIYVDPAHQVALYQALTEAGEEHGMRPFGMRAMMSLRLEKSYGAWMREYGGREYTPAETGLDRFVDFAKNDFIGRDAAVRERDEPPGRRLCTFVVDAHDADVWADEPIFAGRRGRRLRDLGRLRARERQEHRARLRAGRADGGRRRGVHGRDPRRAARREPPPRADPRPPRQAPA